MGDHEAGMLFPYQGETAAGKLPVREEQVSGMYLNIRYENGELYCVTGTSVNFFTLDKSLDEEWDEAVKQFFRKNGIPVSI